MRCITAAIANFLRSFRFVPRSHGGLKARDLISFAVVLPIIAYAYFSQAVITSKTIENERQTRTQYLQSLGNRLTYLAKGTEATVVRYSHWDEMYQAMVKPTPEWLRTKVELGLGHSSNYDVVVLQTRSGELIWSTGFTKSIAADVKRYELLDECRQQKETSGILRLDGRTYIYAAAAVLTSNLRGPSRGMAFVATRIDKGLLGELNAGAPRGLAYLEGTGQLETLNRLGPLSNLPRRVSDTLASRTVPAAPSVDASVDEKISYGCTPVKDIRSRLVGTLIDAESRTSLLANMRAGRRMSVVLMILCLLFAVAGTVYLRTRDLALRANRDELTGLYNHGYLQDFLKAEVMRAARYDRSVSVLMLDIDHFKTVNDTYGHGAGDQALRSIAETVVAALRETDRVARYGGEEFCVVLPETELERAVLTAERLRSMLESSRVRARVVRDREGDYAEIALTVSIGVSTFPYDGKDSQGMIEAADMALAAAKRPRNAVVSYREIVKEHSGSQKASETDAFLRDSSVSSVRSLVAAIDMRDPGSAHHSEKVAEYAVAIGRELGFSTQDLSLTCKAALVHDVGNIGVPDAVLTKNTRLTAGELAGMRRHTKLGADIVSESPQLAPAAEIVLRHHERYDGSGYPDGLTAGDIPLIARVIAVADVMDAMTSPRSYREAVDLPRVLRELQLQAGKQFDPAVVDAAAKVIDRMLGESRQAA